jgi:hypothetical protein
LSTPQLALNSMFGAFGTYCFSCGLCGVNGSGRPYWRAFSNLLLFLAGLSVFLLPRRFLYRRSPTGFTHYLAAFLNRTNKNSKVRS